jgi:hypothetical protein
MVSGKIEESLGWANLAYLSFAAGLGVVVDYRCFVALTSWVHYCKYMSDPNLVQLLSYFSLLFSVP